MDSIIEIQRQSHEEVERYEQALADILGKPTHSSREKLRNEQKALDVLNRISDKKTLLRQQYRDEDGLRATELAAISTPAEKGDELKEFYTRLNKIKQYHAATAASGRNQGIPESKAFVNMIRDLVESDGLERRQTEDGEEVVIDPLDSTFSGEEGMGRFLDLYISHTQYVNLKGARRLAYIQYLSMLISGKVSEEIDHKERESPAYLDYVNNLHTYLLDFLRRTHPLETGRIMRVLKSVEKEFNHQWEEGKVDGWQRKNVTNGKNGVTTGASNGESSGIWCNACQKSYAKQTVYDAHLTSKKHVKAVQRLAAEGGDSSSGPTANDTNGQPSKSEASASTSSKSHRAALLTRLTETLLITPPVPVLLSDSKQNVERKSALTAREREQELEEAAEAEEKPADVEPQEGEEDDDGKIYNPLKLPLGWDGKPIPYWLYKLHGLGVEYKCEICSDYVYMGRKAFDRHFQESRHAFGMRALGLPNTKHFHEITKISDALALADRLKREGRQEQYQAERTEEFEDAEGNVYDKKTYEDLKRQGLI